MKRENLYFVGGALLASTALTTAATAATYSITTASDGAIGTTALKLSAQAFPSNATSATAVGTGTGLSVRLNGPLASAFTATISVSGAKFRTGSVSANDVSALLIATFSGTATVVSTYGFTASADNTMGCAVAFSSDSLILANCDPTFAINGNSTTGSVGGFRISSVGFDNATALSAAGASISLAGSIVVGGQPLDTTAAQAVVTSANSLTATIAATTGIPQLNVNSTPAFANFGSSTQLTTNIGTVSITHAGTVSLDLITPLDTGAELLGAANSFKVTSTIFSDDALVRTNLTSAGGVALTAAPTVFTGGFVTFGAVAAASMLDTFTINVVFNGTSQIDAASAGTVEVTYGSAGGTGYSINAVAPAASSGAVAGLTRAGLNIDINGMQPSVAQGARTYTSLLRIANTGTFAGTVQIVLRNESTGAVLGTYTSPSIPAGASLQLTSANIEAGAGVTATASVLYRATLSGNINGYVQHVNWNQDAGFFSDLSGRRN